MATRTTRSRAAAHPAVKEQPMQKHEIQQLSSPPATPEPAKKKRKASSAATRNAAKGTPKLPGTDEQATNTPVRPAATKKRGRSVKEDVKFTDDELPHNLGTIVKEEPSDSLVQSARKKRRVASPKNETKPAIFKDEEVQAMATKVAASASDVEKQPPAKKPKTTKTKAKGNPYGLTPGISPYPDYPHPTREECYEVTRLLSAVHGEVKPPKEIPAPSLTVSGCGEVPSILDAMIRTRLSAHTSGENAARAFQGLVKKFGILETGIGKGSVDWDAVRCADQKDVEDAIRHGGMAPTKSKDIQKTLQMVYDQNQLRSAALIEASEKGKEGAAPAGAENESADDRNAEIVRAEENVLSLDHLHALSTDDAMNELMKYPGIAVKTAACVAMFCMRRPCFAVDTHVWRLCKWLGWVPNEKNPTRDKTFMHCEVRIPDELKYPLHQLLIKHGKTCGRCRAITGEGSADWSKGCPIDHLVQRTGARKGGDGAGPTPKKAGKKTKKVKDEEDESELSDVKSEPEYTPKKRAPRKRAAKAVKKEPVDDGSDSSELSEAPSDADDE